jgi:hypothetical protein
MDLEQGIKQKETKQSEREKLDESRSSYVSFRQMRLFLQVVFLFLDSRDDPHFTQDPLVQKIALHGKWDACACSGYAQLYFHRESNSYRPVF